MYSENFLLLPNLAIPGTSCVLFQAFPVCCFRHFLSAVPGISCLLFQALPVCCSRHFLSAVPGTSCVLFQAFPVCCSRHFLFALLFLSCSPLSDLLLWKPDSPSFFVNWCLAWCGHWETCAEDHTPPFSVSGSIYGGTIPPTRILLLPDSPSIQKPSLGTKPPTEMPAFEDAHAWGRWVCCDHLPLRILMRAVVAPVIAHVWIASLCPPCLVWLHQLSSVPSTMQQPLGRSEVTLCDACVNFHMRQLILHVSTLIWHAFGNIKTWTMVYSRITALVCWWLPHVNIDYVRSVLAGVLGMSHVFSPTTIPAKGVLSLVRLTLCDPMNCSPPVFSFCGISQARILE